MSFSVKFSAKDHGEADQAIHSATAPGGVKMLLQNTIMAMEDGTFDVDASGHFDKEGGEASVKIKRAQAATPDTKAAVAPEAKPAAPKSA